MVALRAESPSSSPRSLLAPAARRAVPSGLRIARRGRGAEGERRLAHREATVMRAWLMSLEGATRGYVVDVSESGARFYGSPSPLAAGERLLCKLELRPGENPIVVRAELVRNDGVEVALRFVDLNLDEWFRLARYVDSASR